MDVDTTEAATGATAFAVAELVTALGGMAAVLAPSPSRRAAYSRSGRRRRPPDLQAPDPAAAGTGLPAAAESGQAGGLDRAGSCAGRAPSPRSPPSRARSGASC